MNPRDLTALLRPWQWSKNGILLAGVIFSGHLLDLPYLVRALAGLGVFCLASSLIYVVNDILDVERDRLHPEKRDRPLAAGRMGVGAAWILALGMLAVVVAAAWPLGRPFAWVLGAFLAVNTAYSLVLKQVVILDVMMIAVSFVIRAVAGVAVLWPLNRGIDLSPWLLLCTFFLALFLGFGKRRHELSLLEGGAAGHRTTLGEYSTAFLDHLITVVTASVLLSYAIYTVAPGTVAHFGTERLVYTVPFVAFGLFRYLYLVHHRSQGGNPSRLLYRDVPVLITVLGWTAVVVLLLYGRP